MIFFCVVARCGWKFVWIRYNDRHNRAYMAPVHHISPRPMHHNQDNAMASTATEAAAPSTFVRGRPHECVSFHRPDWLFLYIQHARFRVLRPRITSFIVASPNLHICAFPAYASNAHPVKRDANVQTTKNARSSARHRPEIAHTHYAHTYTQKTSPNMNSRELISLNL